MARDDRSTLLLHRNGSHCTCYFDHLYQLGSLTGWQDNFPHDILQFDLSKKPPLPLQTRVVQSADGDYEEFLSDRLCPLMTQFLQERAPSSLVGLQSPLWQRLKHYAAFKDGTLSVREHVPTYLHAFIRLFRQRFPRGRLILSDFDTLPDTISAEKGAPVVQTRIAGQAIACKTYLLKKGFFDIFYPTDFKALKALLERENGSPYQILSHSDFIEKYGDIQATTMQNGENPMRDAYGNVTMLLGRQ